ncbi:MAG: hypothetical protein KDA80_13870, partial [Planctomycetaceae bacterium]|nr:hypothetical protein [Planctomycetaceae bacterium]
IESLVEQAESNLPSGRIETLSPQVTPSVNRLHKSLAKPTNNSNNATGSLANQGLGVVGVFSILFFR